MRSIYILSAFLFVVGCGSSTIQINNLSPDRAFWLPAGTVIDWRSVPEKDLPADLKLYENLMYRADPNAPSEMTRMRILSYKGAFICEDIMDKLSAEMTSEDLSVTWTEKLFKLIGL